MKVTFKKQFKNEKGSMTLEFIGVLPFLLLFVVLLFQVVATGASILSAQSAANEAAKVYALSEDAHEAEQVARDIVGTGNLMSFTDIDFATEVNGNFKVDLNVHLYLAFLPDDWMSYDFNVSANSRLLDYD